MGVGLMCFKLKMSKTKGVCVTLRQSTALKQTVGQSSGVSGAIVVDDIYHELRKLPFSQNSGLCSQSKWSAGALSSTAKGWGSGVLLKVVEALTTGKDYQWDENMTIRPKITAMTQSAHSFVFSGLPSVLPLKCKDYVVIIGKIIK